MDGAAGGLVFFGIWGGFMLLMFGGLGLAIWALVDLLNQPEWAWEYAGENRTTYIVLLAASFFVCQFLAWIPAIMYFKSAKPKVVRVVASMPPPVVPGPYGGYGYGYGYGYAPHPGPWYPPHPGQQYPGQPGPYAPPGAQGPTADGTWSAPPASSDYPSPGQGVPQPQGEPAGDEWWKQPGGTPPQS
jgi:hypothetical protein